MLGQFLTLVRDDDEVIATGTFDPKDKDIKHATVLFMVVQGENDEMVWTHGSGEWNRNPGTEQPTDPAAPPADPDKLPPWVGRAKAQGDGVRGSRRWLEPGDKDGIVRGIAVALVVLPAEEGEGKDSQGRDIFEPPTIQALTWCVSTKLTWA